jgi:kynureninase
MEPGSAHGGKSRKDCGDLDEPASESTTIAQRYGRPVSWSRTDVVELDRDDALAEYRDRFVIDDDALIYLDGNSLGRLGKDARDRVIETLDAEWGARLILSWEERWLELPVTIGDLLGTSLLGADAGEVIVGDSTTVSLYKAIAAALDARPGRRAVVIDEDNFPTDRYVVASLAEQRGLEVRWIPEAGPEGITVQSVAERLDDDVALTVLQHVDYRSAAIADVDAMTAAAHDVGALTIWDLCHSVGVVPIDLHASAVDIAVGCTYKYLSAGPGAPAFTYVRSDLQRRLRQPIWGWFGRRDQFEMALGYQPIPGIGSWQTGTTSILSLAAVEPSVALVAQAGVPAIRQKSERLTALAVELYDQWLADLGWTLRSPREPSRRGSHVTVSHPAARQVMAQAIAAGVIPDFRRPDGIRLGLAPLTTRFVDVFDGIQQLASLTPRSF